MNLNESLAWTTGHHLIQAGFQLPDWSRARLLRSHQLRRHVLLLRPRRPTQLGRPYAFTQQQGNGDLAFLEKQVGTYIKDDWQVRPGLSLVVRPALRLAELLSRQQQRRAARSRWRIAPGNKKTNVLRAGVGVFNDRSGPVVIADVLHSQPGGLIEYVITDPGYPDPFASAARRGGARRRASCGSRPTSRFRRRCSTASASITSCRRR